MFGLKNDEILTYLLLIIVGYTIAKMFSKRCEGFSDDTDPPITICPGIKVPSCSFLHDDPDCETKYTDNITNSGFSKCKKGGLFDLCESSNNECRLGANNPCTRSSDCWGECKDGKCTDGTPPKCPSGESYCLDECHAICDDDEERYADCRCWPKCCRTKNCNPNWPRYTCP